MGNSNVHRSRWAALGAAVAVSVGASGLLTASADIGTGDRPVFVAITPCRIADTRPAPDNVGPRNAALQPNETYTFMVRGTNGNCTIPTDALGVVMNIAAVAPTAASFFTLFPADAPRPLSANLNWIGTQPPVSNAVAVKLSTTGSTPGQVSIYNLAGSVHFTADIVGYFVGHHHDDRYYTETEIDAKVWASAQILDGTIATADLANNSVTAAKVVDFSLTNQDINVLYAAGTSAGVLSATRNSGNVTSTRVGAGSYDVVFNDHAITNCVYIADAGSGPIMTDTAATGPNTVNIHTHRQNDGALTDTSWQLVVVC